VSLLQTHSKSTHSGLICLFCQRLSDIQLSHFTARGESVSVCSHSVACQNDDRQAHVRPADVVVKLLSVLSI